MASKIYYKWKEGIAKDILAFILIIINKEQNYSTFKEEEIICDFIIKEK